MLFPWIIGGGLGTTMFAKNANAKTNNLKYQ